MPASVNQRTVKLSAQKNITPDFYNQVLKIEKETQKPYGEPNWEIAGKWAASK